MADSRKKGWSVFSFILFIFLFFFTFHYGLSWVQVSLRKFAIPVDGGPYLLSNDDWKSEVQTLLQDTTAFWNEVLKREGVSYTPPELIANFEGKRPVCKSSYETDDVVYCKKLSRLELNRINFNGISRFAKPGLNHLAVSYIFAHLIGHHVQAQLGIALDAKTSDPVERRIQIELQADCFAGMWIRHALKTYGTTSEYYLGQAVSRAKLIPQDTVVHIPGVYIENTDFAKVEDRIQWAQRGFRAKDFSECG